MTKAELAAQAARTARAADRASAAFAVELSRVWRDTARRLGPLVAAATEGHPTAVVRAAQAARLRRHIRTALTQAGYDRLVDVATDDPLDQVASHVLAGRRLAAVAASLTGDLTPRLDALKALQLTDLLDEGDQAARALWKATVRGVFNSQETQQILDDLGAVLDRSDAQIRTLYDTSVSIYGRQVEALLAGDDPDTRFLYAGPDDALTRPFCRRHVGHIYTRAEIDALDNRQLDNVFLTAGGYNCRHVWMEVSALDLDAVA